MDSKQDVLLLGRSYPVVASKMNLGKDPLTKVLTLKAQCYIVANDIIEISPWVMEGKQKTDVTLRVNWFNDEGIKRSHQDHTFHNSICTAYREEYNRRLKEPCLWFDLQAETFSHSDIAEEDLLKKPL